MLSTVGNAVSVKHSTQHILKRRSVRVNENKPIVIPSNRVCCYDVDETLVMWNFDETKYDMKDIIWIDGEALLPNKSVIQSLKRNKTRGFAIVVWSQSGYDWGAKVVERLELTSYVDVILCKPFRYYDDLNADYWMGQWKDAKNYEP